MKTLELFCGTKSFSKVMALSGHETFTVDLEKEFNPDLLIDVMDLKIEQLPYSPDMVWASPPCQGFSVAVIGRNWNKDYTPRTKSAELGTQLAMRTLDLIRDLKPKYWFIENPVGMLRKMLFMDHFMLEQGGARHTVSYCQYGDTRMKPTDIWTNIPNWKERFCGRGLPCHEAAPRGSKTGTQGLKGAKDRGVIPPGLFQEILECISYGWT